MSYLLAVLQVRNKLLLYETWFLRKALIFSEIFSDFLKSKTPVLFTLQKIKILWIFERTVTTTLYVSESLIDCVCYISPMK